MDQELAPIEERVLKFTKIATGAILTLAVADTATHVFEGVANGRKANAERAAIVASGATYSL